MEVNLNREIRKIPQNMNEPERSWTRNPNRKLSFDVLTKCYGGTVADGDDEVRLWLGFAFGAVYTRAAKGRTMQLDRALIVIGTLEAGPRSTHLVDYRAVFCLSNVGLPKLA